MTIVVPEIIMIDGYACDVIQTTNKYKNIVPVRKGSLTGVYHKTQKCLMDGWHDGNKEQRVRGRKSW